MSCTTTSVPDSDPTPAPAKPSAPPPHGGAASAARRILIVDDDEDAAWSLATLLKLSLNCVVRIAHDGAQALDAASDMRPHTIFMDITMPGVDGMEAARVLRKLFADQQLPRLVALTGRCEPGLRDALTGCGFDGYLQKPMQLESVLRELR